VGKRGFCKGGARLKRRRLKVEGKLSTGAGWEGWRRAVPFLGGRVEIAWVGALGRAGDAKLAKLANLGQSEARESSNG
jgi:hypothetical protein